MRDRESCRIQRLLLHEGTVWLDESYGARHEGESLLFSEPLEMLALFSASGIREFFTLLEQKLDSGYWLAGWMGYEAGYGFESERFLADCDPERAAPLAWFGVYRPPERFASIVSERMFSQVAVDEPFMISDFRFNRTPAEYFQDVERVKREIAKGNVYQVNVTGRFRFSFHGSAQALFGALYPQQPSVYSAFINTGGHQVLSFSPELFFRRRACTIEAMPMKGTAPRSGVVEEDNRLKRQLSLCEKNRAENLMIVDLLRNDLGRICRSGSVEVSGMFATETYPTLHQMVSTIRGELKDENGLFETFRALYPCGSITGAPKISAMQLIRELEPGLRGCYTGTIGYINPRRDMVFSVAIRTLELSGNEGVYGSGGGIVWDSDPEEEYQECMLKAKILDDVIAESVELFESMLFSGRFLWMQEHLGRLAASARVLGFAFDAAEAAARLAALADILFKAGGRFKVRLALEKNGRMAISYESLLSDTGRVPLKLSLADGFIDSSNPLRFHKTSSRKRYERYYRKALESGYDEVVFLNERQEVTEGAISNIIILKSRRYVTPSLGSGLLDGIYRRYFLSLHPNASEQVLTLKDLFEADQLFICNSVRGLRPVVFDGFVISM
ncbi:MAG: aminodeoxychorismate synthase component I [Chlorobium sp.]|jgi:para-aminobenzoate synthetase/4-amino-4-deoxychorismate lyase|nr:aminodeoxychorismate synthase component I [Chlorobium sp.]